MSTATANNPVTAQEWDRLQRGALLPGVAGLILCLVGAWFSPAHFFRSYLVAFNFWLGIALGCLVILMLQYLTGGAWGILLRRVLEAGTRTLPLLAILFVPLLLGLPLLYGWSRPEDFAEEFAQPDMAFKKFYLAVPFFVARAAVYFAIWLTISFFLNKWSLEQDRNQGSGVRGQESGVGDQGSGVRDQGSGVRDQGSGVRDQGSGVGDQGSGVGDQGSGVGDQGSGVGDQGSGVGDQGSGVGDQGSGVGDQGSGLLTPDSCPLTPVSCLLTPDSCPLTLDSRLRLLSAPGLVLYGLTITFASIDWVMSLEPLWFSTIYPVMFAVGQALEGMAFAVAVIILLAERPPLSGLFQSTHRRDLGNLLLMFVMFWAYMSFSQFLLIWAENLPEEIPWYLRRTRDGWQWIAILLILLQFGLPFLLLLARDVKENPRRLAGVAVLVLAMRFLDLFWWVEAAFAGGMSFYWLLDVAALVGVGGIWGWWFLWQLRQRPLLPLHDPYQSEYLPEACHE